MHDRWSWVFITTFICLPLVIAGCSDNSQPARYPVSGKVLFKGKPTPYAIVCLIPADASEDAEPAAGVVEEDGTFKVLSRKHYEGAEPGEYKVTISWQIPRNPKSTEDPNYGPELLPKKYQDIQTSGLTASIGPTDNELPPFELNP
jgi:hypothetical protein